MRIAASLSVVALLVAGCGVQQSQYDNMLRMNNTLKEDNVRLTEERDAAQSNLSTVSNELADARQHVRTLEGRNSEIRDNLEQLDGRYGDLMDRATGLGIGPLPIEVEAALDDLARTHPQMLSFDADRGMIRFASDFTFALGSVEIQPEAAESLGVLASILNTNEAAMLEVQVVGHTDTVPIGRPETRRAHPTNMHLSVHRAIAVRETLSAAGIEPERIQVAGYGEHRPIAVNGRRGSAANRRVEIFLAPMQRPMASAPDMPSAADDIEMSMPEPMK